GHASRASIAASEDAEVSVILVLLGHIAKKLPEHARVLGVLPARSGDFDSIGAEVRKAKVAQQPSAVCVRIGAHAPVARRSELLKLGDQAAVLVKQLLGAVALGPCFYLLHVLRCLRR